MENNTNSPEESQEDQGDGVTIHDEETVTRRYQYGTRLVWVLCAFVSTLLIILIFPIIGVPTASMTPTLPEGKSILTVRTPLSVMKQRVAHRGDIVVFTQSNWSRMTPGRAYDTQYVKRVIAVAGDHVGGCSPDGRLLLNGQPLHEPYLADAAVTHCNFPEVTVPENTFFAMGDNRRHSRDTRWYVTTMGADHAQDYFPRIDDIASKRLFGLPW